MKRRTTICCLIILSIITTLNCHALDNSRFSFRINCYSTNIIGPLAYSLLGGLIPGDVYEEWYGGFVPYYDIMFAIPVKNTVPDNFIYGEMQNPYYKYFKKQISTWGDWKVGIDGTWDMLYTPFGLYAGLYYKTAEVHFDDVSSRGHYLSPNFGMRLRFGEPYGIQFVMELGGLYDFALGYKGVYDDLKAINSGFTGRAAIGITSSGMEMLLQYDHPFYNFFNKSFTLDDGVTFPLQDVERVVSYISLKIRFAIMD